MPAADPLRPLLDAAAACELGLAPPEVVARALGEVWLGTAGPEESLADRLPVPADVKERLEADLGRRLERHAGDVRAALVAMGGPSPALRRHLLDVAPGLSRAVTTVDTAEGPVLRKVADGRYVDFTPIGEGGMGIVYWALDTELSRQVAFKVVRPPSSGPREGITPSVPLALDAPDASSPHASSFDGLRMRFLQEAWVTGGMEHPGIVPVYELGETDKGIPYYTMRFVRGSRTLDTAMRELAEAGAEERIGTLVEPFLKVCDTVRYAHSRGVVHRDLKCANVGLGEYGEVVLLDWGLAFVKGGIEGGEDPWAERVQSLRDEQGLHTVASAVGTPGYMSPEAARGEIESLDERSDVYTLGVLLYRILTGRLPFPAESASTYAEHVLAEDPPDPAELDAAVPARLADLCRRALARDPAARPPSADAFASEIRTWRAEAARDREIALLLGEASAALEHASERRGDERLRDLDRASTTCRRILDLAPEHAAARALGANVETLRERGIQEREQHARRRALRRAGAAALAVAVVAGIAIGWLLEERRQEAEEARLEARAAQARAEGVMNFMVFELQSSLEPIGRLDVLARIGVTAQDYYASLPREGLSTESLVGHSVALRRLGEVHEARGDLPAALEAYRLAADVAQRAVDTAPSDPVGRYHRSLAQARVAYVVFGQGYSTDAKQLFLEHRRDVERLLEEHPDDAEYRDALASAHSAVGTVLRTEGALEAAGEASRRALEINRAIEVDHPGEERWTRRRIRRQLDLMRQLWLEGDLEACRREGERTLAECLDRTRAPSGAEDVRWLELEAESRSALTVAHHRASDEALRLATESLAAFRALLAHDPSNDRWRRRVAQSSIRLGDVRLRRGDFDGSLGHLKEAYAIGHALTQKDPTNATWLNFLITACDRMAYHGQASAADASTIAGYRSLAAVHARRLVALDPENAKWRHILAFTLSHEARPLLPTTPARALALLRESADLLTTLIGDTAPGPELAVLHAETRELIARLDLDAGRGDAALAQRRLAVDGLDASWHIRQDRAEVLGRLLRIGASLVGHLAQGGPAERAEARRRLDALIETAKAASTGGDDPVQAVFCEDWIPQLEAQRETMEAEERGAK